MLVNNFVFRAYKSTSQCVNLDVVRLEKEKLLFEAQREGTEKVTPMKTPPPNNKFEQSQIRKRILAVRSS